MANYDDIRARFEEGISPDQMPSIAPEISKGHEASGSGFSPLQTKNWEPEAGRMPYAGNATNPEEVAELKAKYDRLEEAVGDLQVARSTSGKLEEMAVITMATNTANSIPRKDRGGKTKVVAATIVGATLGAGGMFLLLKNELNEYASAAQECEFVAPSSGDPFLEDSASDNAPASPTTIPAAPNQNRTAVNAVTAGEVITPEVAGNLQLSGAAFAIQEFSDGSLIESDTVFEWETLIVNADHDNYVIELQQQTTAGYVSDSRMQRYIAEADYTQEELLQFLVKNYIVDPNVSNAYIKLVGSDGEELTAIVTGG